MQYRQADSVAAILARSASDPVLLDRHITYKASDRLTVYPITKTKLTTGASVAELCAATLRHGDNAAANLLLKIIGVAAAKTRCARSIRGTSLRLDRNKPGHNSAIPGDLRDTTTPIAVALSLRGLLLSDKLGASQREQLMA